MLIVGRGAWACWQYVGWLRAGEGMSGPGVWSGLWDMLIVGRGAWACWQYVRWLRVGEGMPEGADLTVSGTA